MKIEYTTKEVETIIRKYIMSTTINIEIIKCEWKDFNTPSGFVINVEEQLLKKERKLNDKNNKKDY